MMLNESKFLTAVVPAFCVLVFQPVVAASDNSSDSPQVIRQQQWKEQSLKRIQSQTGEHYQGQKEAVARQASQIKASEVNVEDLHNQNQKALELMMHPQVHYGSRGKVREARYTTGEIAAAKEKMAREEAEAQRNREILEERAYQLQQKASRALQEEQEGLESQMEQSKPGAFKMSPLGTNLYVRNYQVGSGTEDAEQKFVDPLRARPNVLKQAASGGYSVVPVQSQTSVLGKLLPKR
jgi:hypothetical protein